MSNMSNSLAQSWWGQKQDVIKLPARPTHLPGDGRHLVRTDMDSAYMCGQRQNVWTGQSLGNGTVGHISHFLTKSVSWNVTSGTLSRSWRHCIPAIRLHDATSQNRVLCMPIGKKKLRCCTSNWIVAWSSSKTWQLLVTPLL